MDEINNKIRWSYVKEGVTIFEGKSYCYDHLLKEINKESKKEEPCCEMPKEFTLVSSEDKRE
jgi:hypothetical protein